MPRIIKPVAKGDIAVPTIQVDSSGRIFSASAGSAGGGMYQPTRLTTGPSSGTHTVNPASNAVGVYLFGGGGGAGGPASNPNGKGGPGGPGGFGYYDGPVSGGAGVSFTAGAGGSGGNPSGSPASNISGTAGAASTFGTFAANGGNAGGGATDNPGPSGTAGSAPGATFTYNVKTQFIGGNTEFGTGAGAAPVGGTANGNAGAVIVFENNGGQ